MWWCAQVLLLLLVMMMMMMMMMMMTPSCRPNGNLAKLRLAHNSPGAKVAQATLQLPGATTALASAVEVAPPP
jgi:hypothetical protein